MRSALRRLTWTSPMIRRPSPPEKTTHSIRSRYLPGGRRGGERVNGCLCKSTTDMRDTHWSLDRDLIGPSRAAEWKRGF